MPKHDEALTVLACGIPLSFALYGAVASLLRLRRIMRGDDSALFHTRRARGAWGVGFVAVAVVGWLTTEGTFKAYAETAFGLESNSESWWAQTWFPALLVRADLRNVDFSYRPDDWKDFEQARSTFHREWCEANDLSPAVCGPVPDSDTVESEHQQVARLQWCRDALTLGGGANATRQRQRCTAYFDEWRAAFRQEWKDRRDLQRSTLQRRTLSGADLRGADLFGARMEGADLEGARMEAAVVWQARREGADLDGARMEGAVLVGARMEGASLIGARMEGANLSRARMEGAVLSGARMEGASLWEARMEGADLSQARMNRSTSLFNAALRGASVKDVDYSSVQLSPDQVMSMFGDTTVKLPVGMDRPKHWPAWELPYFALDDGPTFFSEWHRWQADTENYVPPPPP